MNDLIVARQWYADELRYIAHIRSSRIVQAFSTVPREHFLGSGPWQIVSPDPYQDYWTTEDADPKHLYHNVLVAIDAARHLNNGQPSLWAHLFQTLAINEGERVLHIGCGTGYYTALLAEIVGQAGQVTAIEYDQAIAQRAHENLADRAQIEVIYGDGCLYHADNIDVIIVNAGVTHPQSRWLDALTSSGRLLIPLTNDQGGGGYLKVQRMAEGYKARFVSPVGIFQCASGRDSALADQLKEAFAAGYRHAQTTVNSLRRDAHEPDGTCWLHGEDFCLSSRLITESNNQIRIEK